METFLVGFLIGMAFLVIPLSVQAPKIEWKEPSQFILLGGNTLKSQYFYWEKPLKYGSIINCLEYYESSICKVQKREKCIGDHNTSFGCLQFKFDTFKKYCVEYYKLARMEDIWDCQIQKECAEKMLEDNWNNIYHWSTWKKCSF